MLGLSKGQRAAIVDRLRRNKKYSLLVTSVGAEVDTLNYARDLADALREAGWEVCVPSPAGYLPTESVFVGVNDVSSPHPSAGLLVDVLTSVGIRARLVPVTDAGPSGCCLIVAGTGNWRVPGPGP
jgi:hypothetical protein